MKISVFGLGYVGAVSLACLARDGHDLVGVDIDENKLNLIQQGKSPIIEEGIQELMQSVASSGRVDVTTNVAEGIAATDVSFICVGTPSAAHGGQDMTAIERVAENIGTALKGKQGFHTVVVRSTVRPGTLDNLVKPVLEKHSGKTSGEDFGLCFQPEFLREGTSIKDYDNPPFTVVGTDSSRASQILKELFGHLPCEFHRTSIATAEMLKYACNSFHAAKITFANEIGRISQHFGVDSHEVMDLVCQDTRLNISPAYLRPGFAFGGSCLPKDLRAILYEARMGNIELPMLASLLTSNNIHVDHAIDMVLSSGKRSVGMIGLSFKSGTDDLRESPLVVMAERFIGKGLNLKIYDPEVNVSRLVGANRRYITETIPHIASLMLDDFDSLVSGCEILVVGLQDADLLERLPELVRRDQQVIDLVRIPRRAELAGAYTGCCW